MMRVGRKSSIAVGLLLLAVLGATLIAGCAGSGVETPGSAPAQIIRDITPKEAYALIQDNKGDTDFVIIDVRTPEEVADGYIAGSINLNSALQTFREDLDRLDKNKTYLVYCRSGARSARAVGIMAELGFREVYNMLGGIGGWQGEGFPVVK
ncbi:rhodanese-like domain-containing protein [Chloroflexota bacterium]